MTAERRFATSPNVSIAHQPVIRPSLRRIGQTDPFLPFPINRGVSEEPRKAAVGGTEVLRQRSGLRPGVVSIVPRSVLQLSQEEEDRERLRGGV